MREMVIDKTVTSSFLYRIVYCMSSSVRALLWKNESRVSGVTIHPGKKSEIAVMESRGNIGIDDYPHCRLQALPLDVLTNILKSLWEYQRRSFQEMGKLYWKPDSLVYMKEVFTAL